MSNYTSTSRPPSISSIRIARTRTPSLERVQQHQQSSSNGPKIIRQPSIDLDEEPGSPLPLPQAQQWRASSPSSPLPPLAPSFSSTATMRPTSSFSLLPSSTTSASVETGGRSNGPLVTRVQSIMGRAPTRRVVDQSDLEAEEEETREELDQEKKKENRDGGDRGGPSPSISRNNSLGHRCQLHQRDQTSESSTTTTTSTSVWNGGFTPKASRDPLLVKIPPPTSNSLPPPVHPSPFSKPIPIYTTSSHYHRGKNEQPSPSDPPPASASHPHHPNFQISQPFTQIPSIPILSSHKKPLKRYELHQGSNRFFLKGFCLSSKDNFLPFLGSLSVAFGLPVLWIVFIGRGIWVNDLFEGGGGKGVVIVFGYLCLISWSSMLKTALGDPGILPRNLDPNPTRKYVENEENPSNGEEKLEAGGRFVAEMKYLRVRDGVVGSKWCETCEIYRPPRTSHCRLCDNCVELTDHHCAFLNNCIGRRNYFPFLSFLSSSILLLLYSITFTSYYISQRSSLSRRRWDSIGSYIVLGLLVMVLIPLGGLILYHFRLVLNNQTTIEMLRPKSSRGGLNPQTGENLENLWKFSSKYRNCLSVVCRPGIGEYGGRGGWRDLARRDKRVGGGEGGKEEEEEV